MHILFTFIIIECKYGYGDGVYPGLKVLKLKKGEPEVKNNNICDKHGCHREAKTCLGY